MLDRATLFSDPNHFIEGTKYRVYLDGILYSYVLLPIGPESPLASEIPAFRSSAWHRSQASGGEITGVSKLGLHFNSKRNLVRSPPCLAPFPAHRIDIVLIRIVLIRIGLGSLL